jgi:hypothetical protein
MKNLFSSIKPIFHKIKSNKSSIIFVPAIIGSHVGAVCIGFEFFMDSRKEPFAINVMKTGFGIFTGCCVGFIGGYLWPVLALVMIGRKITSLEK